MTRKELKRATIHDVAQLAGVSYQTVSRVVNDHVNVASATRTRVLRAIKTLNYQPNIVAKSLVTRNSQLLGLLAVGTEQYGPAQIVQGVERSARARGYETLLSSLPSFSAADVSGAARRLLQFGVDGLILLTPYDAHEIAALLGTARPFVLIDATPGVNGTTVSIDQRAGGVVATKHLLDLGHTNIVHLSGPAQWSDAALRAQGYREAMQARGLPVPVTLSGDWSAQSGFNAIDAAIRNGTDFTALVAANDQMALGAIAALRALNLRVPEDISVVGFDNIPESAFFSPGLTTVMQDFLRLGRTSVEELLSLMDVPGEGAKQVSFQPQLVLRSSTGPRPPSH